MFERGSNFAYGGHIVGGFSGMALALLVLQARV
jgi:hypothetical protein